MSASNAPPVPLSPIPTPSLSNTSVLITGGASGLGLAIVRALAAAGAHITIATNVPITSSTLSSFQASGYHVQEVVCDVTDWDSLHRAFKHALAFSPTGALDVVAMFAGVDNGPNLVDHVGRLDAEGEPKLPSTVELDVNLKGSLYTSALPVLHLNMTTYPCFKTARISLPPASPIPDKDLSPSLGL
jgi:NAD(P)-dependent dehydrogenase (short-subunit alcohol dehydrogenase family)